MSGMTYDETYSAGHAAGYRTGVEAIRDAARELEQCAFYTGPNEEPLFQTGWMTGMHDTAQAIGRRANAMLKERKR